MKQKEEIFSYLSFHPLEAVFITEEISVPASAA